jgi:hypothetical protein
VSVIVITLPQSRVVPTDASRTWPRMDFAAADLRTARLPA